MHRAIGCLPLGISDADWFRAGFKHKGFYICIFIFNNFVFIFCRICRISTKCILYIYILFYYLLQKLFCCRVYQIYSNLNNCFVGVFVRFICSLVLKFLQSSVVCLWCVFYTVFGLHIVTLIIPVWAAQSISSKNLNKLQYLYL